MAAAGTLLQDLDSTSGGDNDLVQKILSDMNAPAAPGPRPIPPSMPAQTPMAEQRMASGNSQFTMDSTIPTSHMIGNQHPSPADFAAAVAGARPQEPMYATPYTTPVGVMPGSSSLEMPQKKGVSWLSGFLLDELKTPLLVAILFFLFSLPPMRIVMSHYIPSIVKQTGEYSTTGLGMVSLILGATFWVLQRVVAPLLSL